ncbi:unnamed protein product [Cylicocyclus nassatus]|uniref:Uncharacterized protein n=1 Tax=Cylicocyclus nassatus TaxID=53992 RepID=A0AA36GV45_CYLNA|nr:unnamed protein product [Cylicocyclus nassatus]
MAGMEVDGKTEDALLFWVNAYGDFLHIESVTALDKLWREHLPSLLNCLKNGNSVRVVSPSAQSVYQELFTHFSTLCDQERFVQSISAEMAAKGDKFEIAKFLAILLNEFRISQNEVIASSVRALEKEGHDVPITALLNAFDSEKSDWWSVMLSQSPRRPADDHMLQFVTPRRQSYPAEEFTGMSVNRSSFITPRCPPRRNESNAHTVARCEGSPLLDAINSPKVRDLRKEREIRGLRKQINELEDQISFYEKNATDAKHQTDKLLDEVASKKARIRELELEKKLLQQHCDESDTKATSLAKRVESLERENGELKRTLTSHKASAEKFEDERVQLQEQLAAKQEIMQMLERKARDACDELDRALEAKKSIEQEKNSLASALEKLTKSTESDNEQYHAALADCRKRYEDEISKHATLYSEEMARNADLQKHLREMSEKLEDLQVKYDSDTTVLKRSLDEVKKSSKEKYDAIVEKMNEIQLELADSLERSKTKSLEHEEELKRLENVHAEAQNRKDVQLTAVRARIKELEEKTLEQERTARDLRKHCSDLTAERGALEAANAELLIKLESKSDDLKDVKETLERLQTEMDSLKLKHGDSVKSCEVLQLEVKRLQRKIHEGEGRINDLLECEQQLMTLKEQYSNVLEEAEVVRQDREQQKKHFETTACELKNTIEALKVKVREVEEKNENSAREVERQKEEFNLKEQGLCDQIVRLNEEKEQLSSQISLLETDLSKERSARTQIEEETIANRAEMELQNYKLKEMSERLSIVQSADSEQSESLVRLEQELEAKKEENMRAMIECDTLRQKDALRSTQLHDFAERIKCIEHDIALSAEKNTRLEVENTALKDQLEMFEMVFMRKTRSEKRKAQKSLKDAGDPAKRDISPHTRPLFSTSLDESAVLLSRGHHGLTEATEVPAPEPLNDKDFLLKKVIPKFDAATSVSDLAILSSLQPASSQSNLTTTVNGSDLSLAASSTISHSRHSLARSEFSRPSLSSRSEFSRPSLSGLSMGSKRREGPDTDRSRLKELQRRNEMLHPAMRCAYATEVTTYSSPTGSENVVKNGTQSARKGKKLMQRAASYVKRRLPLSESTNSVN